MIGSSEEIWGPWIVWALVAVALMVVVLYWHWSRRRLESLAARLPGPPAKIPFLRNALELGSSPKDIYKNVKRLSEEYNRIFKIWMGPKLFVGLLDPRDIEIIMMSMKCITKGMTYDFLKPWLGTGLLTSTGEKWKKHRKLLTPTFHFKILENFIEAFNKNGNILIEKLGKEANGSSFDIYNYITLCALDVITETAMGVNINSQKDSKSPYVEAIRSECDVIMKRMIRPWLYPSMIFNMTGYGAQERKALGVLHTMTKQVIQRKHEEMISISSNAEEADAFGRKRRVAFLDLLIQESQKGSLLTNQEIQEEVDTFMFEGHDTTTSSICFTLWLLSMHEKIQEKVYAEVETLLRETSGQVPSISVLNDMRYLERVIKESLRLYPSVPLIAREILEELPISDGYILPAGTSIVIPTFMVHRNADIYPNPEEFNPDRFLPENTAGQHPFAYIPFSAGARNCIGQRFAMLEMKATISKILWHYKLLPAPEYPPILCSELIIKSENGIQMKIIPRER